MINIALRFMEHLAKEYNAQFTSAGPLCAGISSLLGRTESTILTAIGQGPSLVLSLSTKIPNEYAKLQSVINTINARRQT
jgi:hypothetical protein